MSFNSFIILSFVVKSYSICSHFLVNRVLSCYRKSIPSFYLVLLTIFSFDVYGGGLLISRILFDFGKLSIKLNRIIKIDFVSQLPSLFYIILPSQIFWNLWNIYLHFCSPTYYQVTALNYEWFFFMTRSFIPSLKIQD